MRPKNAAPNGRTAKPAPNVASDASSAAVSLPWREELGGEERGEDAVQVEVVPLDDRAGRRGRDHERESVRSCTDSRWRTRGQGTHLQWKRLVRPAVRHQRRSASLGHILRWPTSSRSRRRFSGGLSGKSVAGRAYVPFHGSVAGLQRYSTFRAGTDGGRASSRSGPRPGVPWPGPDAGIAGVRMATEDTTDTAGPVRDLVVEAARTQLAAVSAGIRFWSA